MSTFLHDRKVDGTNNAADAATLADCVVGPGAIVAAPACEPADLDEDGDVDLGDLGAFQASYTSSIWNCERPARRARCRVLTTAW